MLAQQAVVMFLWQQLYCWVAMVTKLLKLKHVLSNNRLIYMKIGFDISCKLSYYKILFSGKNKNTNIISLSYAEFDQN